MEAKTVLLIVLILNLVTEQIQVEAVECCEVPCKNLSEDACKRYPGCMLPTAGICPSVIWSPGEAIKPIENKKGAAINEICKLGCASSVCSAISTLQHSGEELVNEAVEQCKNACSAFCTMGSTYEIA